MGKEESGENVGTAEKENSESSLERSDRVDSKPRSEVNVANRIDDEEKKEEGRKEVTKSDDRQRDDYKPSTDSRTETKDLKDKRQPPTGPSEFYVSPNYLGRHPRNVALGGRGGHQNGQARDYPPRDRPARDYPPRDDRVRRRSVSPASGRDDSKRFRMDNGRRSPNLDRRTLNTHLLPSERIYYTLLRLIPV